MGQGETVDERAYGSPSPPPYPPFPLLVLLTLPLFSQGSGPVPRPAHLDLRN